MRAKTVTLSVRISHEDAEFIGRMDVDGATTPSDKLRHLIGEARRRTEGLQDYRGCIKMVHDQLSAVNTQIREHELNQRVHSELVTRTLDWLPDTMAFIMSSQQALESHDDTSPLADLEAGVCDRIFRLMESVLQMGVTKRCPCYEASAIEQRLEPILDLTRVIHTNYKSKKE